MKTYMVFDVESVGLHGEGFQVGYVVVNEVGEELSSMRYQCRYEDALGTREGRDWVRDNCPPRDPEDPGNMFTPKNVRYAFWMAWKAWHKSTDAALWSDCVWPVESNFLTACVMDDPDEREWEGPYPCYDVMTLRLAAGLNPHERCERLPNELPEHDALCDARQSARLMLEAFAILENTR